MTGGVSASHRDRELFNAERLLLCLMTDKRVIGLVKESGIVPDVLYVQNYIRGWLRFCLNYMRAARAQKGNDILNRCSPENVGEISNILISDKNIKDKYELPKNLWRLSLYQKKNVLKKRRLVPGMKKN